jgi:hypothetical protein
MTTPKPNNPPPLTGNRRAWRIARNRAFRPIRQAPKPPPQKDPDSEWCGILSDARAKENSAHATPPPTV